MPSLFGNSAFIKSDSGSASARAIKIADIYIKSRTNSAGVVTDPAVYDQAIAQLAPYSDDLNVQKKITTLQNQQKSVQAKSTDQTITLSSFKRGLIDNVFSSTDNARDLPSLAFATSVKLDDMVNSVNEAIATLQEQGKSTDQLQDYQKQLSRMANAQRDLVNKLSTNTADPNLDGYGYYVHTNPVDGSIIGAALLPVGYAPSEITDGLKRLSNSSKVGNSSLPVFVSASQAADGTYSAKVGQTTWTSDPNNKDTLVSADGNTPADYSFDIKDTNKFPSRDASLKPGQFGRVVVGVENDTARYAYFYKGMDGKIYNVNQDSLAQMQSDPLLSKQLSGYVPLLSPEDAQKFTDVQPLVGQDLTHQEHLVGFAQAQANSKATQEQLAKTNSLYDKAGDVIGQPIRNAVKATGGFFKKIFSRGSNQTSTTQVNQPVALQEPSASINGQPSGQNVIDQGKGFFRNVA